MHKSLEDLLAFSSVSLFVMRVLQELRWEVIELNAWH